MVGTKNFHYLIDECKTLTTELIEKLSVELIKDIEKQLDQYIDQAASNQLHMDAFESSRTFRQEKEQIRVGFFEKIQIGFTLFKTKELSTHVRENEFHNEAWSLVDDTILEETIAINTQASQATVEYQDKLWQLNQRLTAINEGITVVESNNPLSPVQFYVALRDVLKPIKISANAKLASYKSMATVIDTYYPTIINKVNALLITQGILPEIRYETSSNEYVSPGKDTSENNVANNEAEANTQALKTNLSDTEETEDNPQLSLSNIIRNLLKKARNVDNEEVAIPIANKNTSNDNACLEQAIPREILTEGDISPESIIFSHQQIVGAVEHIQQSTATAHFFSDNNENHEQILEAPSNISKNSTNVYNQLYNTAPDGAINAQNMYTIDMVGMLFEYILSDENLPDSIKTLLSHLHTPVLKLAFLDNRFFEDQNHKARMLLDSLAEAGTNWVNHDGTSQYDMYNEIKRVVQRAVKEFKSNVNFFAELLIEFNLLKKRVSHMHNLRERNSIEKKQGQEKHDQAKILARQAIKKRIEGKRVPSSIISLLSPWFTYLTFIYLRKGDQSKHSKKALRAIDNLLMYCSVKQVKQDNHQLSENFDNVISIIEEGLSIIAYNPKKAATIINELQALKHNILNKKAIKTTSVPAKQTPETTIGTTTALNTSSEEEKVMNYIKLIEPGTWIEHENKQRLKVSGYNSSIRKYVLVDQTSQEVIMISRLDFAKDILSSKKKVVDGGAKALFERALTRIRNNLDKQVQVSSIAS